MAQLLCRRSLRSNVPIHGASDCSNKQGLSCTAPGLAEHTTATAQCILHIASLFPHSPIFWMEVHYEEYQEVPTCTGSRLGLAGLPLLRSAAAAAPSSRSACFSSRPLYQDRKNRPYSLSQLPP